MYERSTSTIAMTKTYPSRFACVLLLAAASLLSARAESSPATLEERLARIEKQLQSMESRLNDSVTATELAPTLKEFSDLTRSLGWDGKSSLNAVKPTGKEKTLALGGFVQANFESGEVPDARYAGLSNRFLLRRARLFVSGTFAEAMAFKVESDFGANSLGAKTGQSGQLTDAYISWTKFPAASLRLGQFKTPFGYEQLAADTKIYTVERSLPNDRITLGRQVGLMAFGDVADKRLSYSVGAYNGTGTNLNTNDNQKFLWVGRVAGVVFDGKAGEQKVKVTAGVNTFTTVDKGTFNGRRTGSGVDAQVVCGPAEFQAEWLRADQHPVTGAATAAEGWALLGAYSLTSQWQAVVRYETYDSNIATVNTTTDLWTFGFNYLIKGDDLKLSLNYLSGSQPAPAPHGDRFLARFQFMF